MGYFQGSNVFRAGLTGEVALVSNGSFDAFIARFAPDGQLVWVKTVGGFGDDRATRLSLDLNGQLVVSGQFSGTVDGNPSETNALMLISRGNTDGFVLNLDHDGSLNWIRQVGGAGEDCALGVEAGCGEDIFVGGYYSGLAEFDAGESTIVLQGGNSTDGFVVRLHQPTQPRIQQVEITNGSVQLTFTSVIPGKYCLEAASALTGPWNCVVTGIQGNGGTLSIAHTLEAGQPAQFYRLRYEMDAN